VIPTAGTLVVTGARVPDPLRLLVGGCCDDVRGEVGESDMGGEG